MNHETNRRERDSVKLLFPSFSLSQDIKDIVWPGESHVPPEGVPEKFHMKITFLEEPPFIIVSDPDPVSFECSMNRGVPCRVPG